MTKNNMYNPRLEIVGQDTLGNAMCGPCWEGKHRDCIEGKCRCLHHSAVAPRKRKAKSSNEEQLDVSGYGTIEV